MKTRKILLIIFTLFSFNSFAITKGEIVNNRLKDISNICKNILNTYECSQKIEKVELPKYPNIAQKNKDEIILKLENEEKIYQNTDQLKYSFLTYIPEVNFIMIHIQGDEWQSVDIINYKTGASITTSKTAFFDAKLPEFSPNVEKMLIFNSNEMDTDACGLQIWDLKNNNFRKEYEDLTFRYYGDAKWQNNNKIKINYDFINQTKSKDPWERYIMFLEYKNNVWEVQKTLISEKINGVWKDINNK